MTRLTALALAAIALIAMAVEPAFAAKKPTPKLGRSVVVKPAGGSVLVKQPGKKAFKLKKATSVTMGTTFDTLKGKVSLTSKKAGKGTQTGVFSQGKFKVSQRTSDGLTDLTLTGGDLGACAAAARAGKPITGAASRRRRLFGRAHGRFRTRGRNSSATVRGTEWLTEDTCDGTVVKNMSPNESSKVDTATNEIEFTLEPGQTATGYCNRFDIAPDTYCVMLLAQPDDGLIGAGIIAQTDEPTYALCVQRPDGEVGCYEYALTERDEDGFRLGVIACPVGEAGEYFVGWSLDYKDGTPTLLDPPGALSLTLNVPGPAVDCVTQPKRAA